MLLEALTIGQMQWLQVEQQQMLLCPERDLQQCVKALPDAIQSRLPTALELKQNLEFRQGFSLTFSHSDVKGMVLYKTVPQALIAKVGYQLIDYRSEFEISNFLIHEIGHIVVKATINEQQLAPLFSWQCGDFEFQHYQDELLADLYAMWSMAQSEQYPERIAALVDKRNLMLVNDTQNRYYWSVPIIQDIRDNFAASEIKNTTFATFINKVWQLELKVSDPGWYQQMIGLFKAEFSLQPDYHQPSYLRWHRRGFGEYLKPTLERHLGAVVAQNWLKKRALL
ncbi:hypothetical protein [Paraferrimonas sp. SM1919]|uniref:hypothetical protein n=1 Tax=Paraferrimonas sp. SM1919 TaxID=2662263 RepID=UPI0013D16BAE|nr:hypothetical protein [Paraferrimonas sp. SM1919]